MKKNEKISQLGSRIFLIFLVSKSGVWHNIIYIEKIFNANPSPTLPLSRKGDLATPQSFGQLPSQGVKFYLSVRRGGPRSGGEVIRSTSKLLRCAKNDSKSPLALLYQEGEIKNIKSQVELKIKKIYFISNKTHQNGYRFV